MSSNEGTPGVKTITYPRTITTSRIDVLLGHDERQLLDRLQEHLRARGYKLSLASVLRLGLKTLAQQEGLDA